MRKIDVLNAIEKVIKSTITNQAIKQKGSDYVVLNLSLVRYRTASEEIYKILKKSVKDESN